MCELGRALSEGETTSNGAERKPVMKAEVDTLHLSSAAQELRVVVKYLDDLIPMNGTRTDRSQIGANT